MKGDPQASLSAVGILYNTGETRTIRNRTDKGLRVLHRMHRVYIVVYIEASIIQ